MRHPAERVDLLLPGCGDVLQDSGDVLAEPLRRLGQVIGQPLAGGLGIVPGPDEGRLGLGTKSRLPASSNGAAFLQDDLESDGESILEGVQGFLDAPEERGEWVHGRQRR